MRDFDILDPSSFRAFWTAAEELNFTEAARRASMTQSGISQHVAKLEGQLGVPLFLRSGRKVFLTDAGRTLKRYIERYLDDVTLLKDEITQQEGSLEGPVAYAMPESCLKSPHFGILLEARLASFPQIELDVTICDSLEVIERLLDNQVQFGFSTIHTEEPSIHFEPFCIEEYALVGSRQFTLDRVTATSLLELPFIDYPGHQILFRKWRQHHFPRSTKLSFGHLRTAGKTNSLETAMKMISGGLGVGIIPVHGLAELITAGEVRVIGGAKKTPVRNQIFIVFLNGAHPPRRVEAVLEVFRGMVELPQRSE